MELGEIETALNQLPNVTQVVVIVNKDIPDQNQLIAYLTSSKQKLALHLRNQLSDLLPAYLVPGQSIVLPEFPLTPNGKIDKNSLQLPGNLPAPAPLKVNTAFTPMFSVKH